jgi:hypothetical protein
MSRLTLEQKVKILIAVIGAIGVIVAALIQIVPSSPTETSVVCSINNLGWMDYQNDGLGSTISVGPVLDSNCAVKIMFDLKSEGWVAAYKKLDPGLLSASQGIKFSYSGTGVANTLEFKLIEKDTKGKETIFYVEWGGATMTGGKTTTRDVYYKDMVCRQTPGSRCVNGTERINAGQTDRIDFSLSNKPVNGNASGQGEVIIKEIQFIP